MELAAERDGPDSLTTLTSEDNVSDDVVETFGERVDVDVRDMSEGDT